MGKLTNVDGTIFHEGKWSFDRPIIKQTKQYPDGIYMGMILDGQKDGQGKFEYTDGTYHEGIFF